MQNVIDRILEKHPRIPRKVYEDNFFGIYGIFWHDGEVPTQKMVEEIEYIENIRLEECIHEDTVYYDEIPRQPEPTCVAYSGLAFTLAYEHMKTKRVFEIADVLAEVYLFIVDNYLTKEERNKMKRLISETVLDFGYAAGNDRATSFRIANYLR